MTVLIGRTTNTVFSNFDVISDHSDHHYSSSHPEHYQDRYAYDTSPPHYASNPPRNASKPIDIRSNTTTSYYKRIAKEWKILEESLPESIFVRVYENRIDLMRAVIVGAAGTPYHDGLFFFDIGIPYDYPYKPPKVTYRSFGLHLNPNLYPGGDVCLSLLNTWSGDKTERWDPKVSTLLQVLVSLQGLVLNENPFYNEPIHRGLPLSYGQRSLAYNEEVFHLTCKSSIHLIRNPPRKFGKFVKAHFRDRAVTILRACQEYVNGRVRVGYYGCHENNISHSNYGSSFEPFYSDDISSLEQFKFNISMKKLYPDLVERFRSCGAVLESSLKQLVLEEEKQVKDEEKSKTNIEISEEEPPKMEKQVKNSEGKCKKNRGILKKAVAKIKKVLGWKNSGKDKMTANELE